MLTVLAHAAFGVPDPEAAGARGGPGLGRPVARGPTDGPRRAPLSPPHLLEGHAIAGDLGQLRPAAAIARSRGAADPGLARGVVPILVPEHDPIRPCWWRW
jgi:hypothetical protein